MKLDADNNEIKYVGTDASVAKYLLVLDGEPTMQILCDYSNKDQRILIAPVGAISMAQATKGQFTLTPDVYQNGNDEVTDVVLRVDEKSVYTYIVPRMHVLLGRLLRAA
jgi:hypothetical protein